MILLRVAVVAGLFALLAYSPATVKAQAADDDVPSLGEVIGADITRGIQNTLAAAQEARARKQEASEQIAAARNAYWEAYPDGAGLAELEAVYGEQLAQKDMYYLTIGLADRVAGDDDRRAARRMAEQHPQLSDVKGRADLMDKLSGRLDGGITASIDWAFEEWVGKVQRELGPAGILNLNQAALPKALAAAAEEYKRYKQLRDLDEFFKNGALARVTDPRRYYQLISVRQGLPGSSMSEAGKSYDLYVELLGGEPVHAAIAELRKAPLESDGWTVKGAEAITLANRFAELLRPHMANIKDPRVLGALQMTRPRFTATHYAKAREKFERMVTQHGEAKAFAAVERSRKNPADELELLLPIEPEGGSAMEVVYNFSKQVPIGEFLHLAEGLDGWIVGVSSGGYDEVTRERGMFFKLRTDGSEFTVLARGVINPSSIAVSGGWIYATAAPPTAGSGTNLVCRVRQDGSGFEWVKTINQQAGNLGGPDPDGNVFVPGTVLVYGACIFRITPEGKATVIAKSSNALKFYDVRRPTVGQHGVVFATSDVGFLRVDPKKVGDGVGLPPDGATWTTGGAMVNRKPNHVPKGTAKDPFVLGVDPVQPPPELLASFKTVPRPFVSPMHGITAGPDGKVYWLGSGPDAAVCVARMNQDGSGYQVIWTISVPKESGETPWGVSMHPPAFGRDGRIYLVLSRRDGADGGVVLRVWPDGSGYDVLHDFAEAMQYGSKPYSGLMAHSDGSVYGTSVGGTNRFGSLYRITPPKADAPTVKTERPPIAATPAAVAPAAPTNTQESVGGRTAVSDQPVTMPENSARQGRPPPRRRTR